LFVEKQSIDHAGPNVVLGSRLTRGKGGGANGPKGRHERGDGQPVMYGSMYGDMMENGGHRTRRYVITQAEAYGVGRVRGAGHQAARTPHPPVECNLVSSAGFRDRLRGKHQR
jgi:hypothetical protein